MTFLRTPSILLCAALLLTTLPSCSTKGDKKDVVDAKDIIVNENKVATTLYNDALSLMDDKHYEAAIEKFEEIERVYPYARWAIKSQLMTALAHYKNESYDHAVDLLERFIQLHPGNEEIDYAYYLRALAYYNRIADIGRDQYITKQAGKTLSELITRFPDTDYARDAKLKLDLVNDHLAGKEMEVGRFYVQQEKYIAAVNRFSVVVDKYDTTTHIEEALYRLSAAYLAIGVIDEAKRYAAILGHNHPKSKWYERTYALFQK